MNNLIKQVLITALVIGGFQSIAFAEKYTLQFNKWFPSGSKILLKKELKNQHGFRPQELRNYDIKAVKLMAHGYQHYSSVDFLVDGYSVNRKSIPNGNYPFEIRMRNQGPSNGPWQLQFFDSWVYVTNVTVRIRPGFVAPPPPPPIDQKILLNSFSLGSNIKDYKIVADRSKYAKSISLNSSGQFKGYITVHFADGSSPLTTSTGYTTSMNIPLGGLKLVSHIDYHGKGSGTLSVYATYASAPSIPAPPNRPRRFHP